MRAAPAFQVSLRRFGVWRGGVCAVSALGLVVVGAWLMTREVPLASPTSLIALFMAMLALAFGVSLVKTPATELRWDGRVWHLGAVAGDSVREPVSGELSVAIDLGPWMLLRFTPASTESRSRVVWLPVQRRGLESAWHALRCSVYSPRPAPADDSPAGF